MYAFTSDKTEAVNLALNFHVNSCHLEFLITDWLHIFFSESDPFKRRISEVSEVLRTLLNLLLGRKLQFIKYFSLVCKLRCKIPVVQNFGSPS
jgi:hypothetical protein